MKQAITGITHITLNVLTQYLVTENKHDI